MDVTNVNQETFADLFPTTDDAFKTARFGAQDNPVDLFDGSTTNTTTAAASTTESTTESVTETTTKKEGEEADILAIKEKEKVEAPKLESLSSYYEDRVKSGKFVGIKEEGEDGKEKPFVPKTPEDFDEVIDIQVNHKFEQEKEKINNEWYSSKSPAWQAVAKYAELTDNPSEILPFLQGVQVIDSVKDLDPADPAHAEQIVRTRFQQKGDTPELVEEQVESLKAADKLSSAAQKYKPLILEQEKQQLSQMVEERKQEEEEWNKLVVGIRENAIKAIEAPIFGKQKLKQDEKAAIYSLIAMPSQETKGYAIYNEIDSLFQKADFQTLAMVSLLIAKKDAFLSYIASGAADKTAESLQRKLRIATENSSSSSNNVEGAEERKTVRRENYNGVPRFGR